MRARKAVHPFLPSLLITILGLLLLAGSSPGERSRVGQPEFVAAYGKLPLAFEANQGQTDPQVKFLARGRGYTLFLTATEAVLRLAGTRDQAHVVRMKLLGANPSPVVAGLERMPGSYNYFLGNDPQRWKTNVPGYQRVAYHNVYPGIDLIYYGGQQHLEYDLVVEPGAHPESIRLRFEGADKLEIDGQGDLVLETAAGYLRLKKPAIYQPVHGQKRPVAGDYVKKSEREIAFQVGAYDANTPLVLDPVLVYSTYLGGSAFDVARGIAVDSAGSAYITGVTNSLDFPTSPPFESAFGGGNNVFVTKLTPAGDALVYSTSIGGLGDDTGQAIAVDAAGNAYVTGSTSSENFPTAGAFQAQPARSVDPSGVSVVTTDAFVLKLNADGTSLVYSSYLGGAGTDIGRGIAVDGAGNAYLTGNTTSLNFPAKNPFQAAKGDTNTFSSDAFAAKVNAAGNALVYSTYLGGSADDQGFAIAADSAGNAYVTGQTFSVNFPTVNPLQAARGGNPSQSIPDAFVTKINPAGSELVFSTYLGGSSNDQGNGIAVDAAGNAYVTGLANSRDFPVVPLQPVLGTAFVAKLNAQGSALIYSRSVGGNGTDVGAAVAVDSAGNAYVTGVTTSTNFPTVNSIQRLPDPRLGFFQIAFVTKLDPTGTSLVYSTPLGGGSDSGAGIAVDPAGNAYVTGQTFSFNFPTIKAYQSTFGGSADGFVAKIADTTQPAPAILANGVVNAASFRPATDPNGAIAPGAIVAIFGSNLAPGSRLATTLPLPTNLFDTQVTFNGTAAPLFYVSATQINAQAPFEVTTGTATVVVQRGGSTSAAQTARVAAVSPGIFYNLDKASGIAIGAVLHAKTFAPVTDKDPAIAGEFLSIFSTGLGALQQPVSSGTVPPSPPPETVSRPTVTIANLQAPVIYSGLAARFAGVYQVNVQVPAGVPSGTQPLQVTIGGVPSNTVSLFVK